MKKLGSILFLATIFWIATFLYQDNPRIQGRMPVPVEFVEKKSKRKDFKQQRKEYMLQMHQSHPDVDWKKMNADTRKKRTDKVRQIRQELLTNGNSHLLKEKTEFINRNLTGYWQERGSNNLAGRILTADIDWESNLIYCASDGGNIWRGSLTGENWTSLTDYMQIKGIHFLRLIEFEDTRRLLIAHGDNVYYTDDEGETLQLSNGLDFLSGWSGNYLKRVIVTENKMVYVLATEGTGSWNNSAVLYKSVDHGRNFTKFLTLDTNAGMSSNQNSDHFDIWTARYFESQLFILHNNEFYQLTESDELEFLANIPVSGSGQNILTGGMGSNYPFFFAHVAGRIYQSMNGGNSWIDRGEKPQWIFNLQNSFNCSNIHRDQVFWGGMEVFKSTNGGSSWNLVNNWWEYYGNEANMLHADIPEVRFFLDPEYNEVALISTDGGLYYSEDGLESVSNLSMNGLGVSQYYSTYTKRTFPYHVYAGSQDQGFQRSLHPDEEGVLNFEQSISGDYGHLVSGDGGETIWCNYPGFTMYYQNPLTNTGGETLNFPGSGHLWLAPLMADPYDPAKAYLGGGGLSGGNHLFHLTMGSWSISYEEEPFSFSGTVSAMAYSPLEPENRYVLTSTGKFYHSSNNGEGNLWEQSSGFNGPGSHYFYGSTIWVSESVPGKVIIGGSGYSNPPVFVSEDHGNSFESMAEGLPNTLVYNLAGTPDDGYIFAATEVGPFVYDSSENTWQDLAGITAPDQTYWTVEYIPELSTARFGTYGRGIWDFVLDETTIIAGDVNLDEVVNIQDLVLLVNFILGIEIPDASQTAAGDINNDSVLNIQDIIATVNIIIGN